jgi:hypothetical protein
MALALTAALLLSPAEVPQCAPGLIHSPPLCLTAEQFEAMWNPPPPAPPSSPVSGVEQWRSMVAYYWGKHGATDRMLRIMKCESGGLATAKNPRSSATGLFQIMGFWQKVWPGDYTDPWTNAAVAYQIWLSQGYAAWVCKG